MRIAHRMVWSAVALAAVLAAAPGLRAEPVADFYRGKTMKVIIGYGPGGGYDLYGRLAAEFLGRHIPGSPTIVPENMPGGGSLKAILYLYQVAPQDGTYLGSVSQQLAANAVTDEKNTMAVALGGPINFLNQYEQAKSQNVDRPWDTWRKQVGAG